MQGLRKTMEDHSANHLDVPALPPGVSLFSVFDGHSGDATASFAAAEVVRHIQEAAAGGAEQCDGAGRSDGPSMATAIAQAYADLDTALLQQQVHGGSGSTAITVAVLEHSQPASDTAVCAASAMTRTAGGAGHGLGLGLTTLVCANAGDSRAVFCRAAPAGGAVVVQSAEDHEASRSGSGALSFVTSFDCAAPESSATSMLVRALSADHKPIEAAEKARIEAAGGCVVVDPRFPAVSRIGLPDGGGGLRGGLAVSRALGDFAFYKEVQGLPVPPALQQVVATPALTVAYLRTAAEPVSAPAPAPAPAPAVPRPGVAGAVDDFIVIGSDGVWDAVTSQEAAAIVSGALPRLHKQCFRSLAENFGTKLVHTLRSRDISNYRVGEWYDFPNSRGHVQGWIMRRVPDSCAAATDTKGAGSSAGALPVPGEIYVSPTELAPWDSSAEGGEARSSSQQLARSWALSRAAAELADLCLERGSADNISCTVVSLGAAAGSGNNGLGFGGHDGSGLDTTVLGRHSDSAESWRV